MDPEKITAFIIAAGEYRRYASRLADVLDYFAALRNEQVQKSGAGYDTGSVRELDKALDRMEAQIRMLRSLADDMEEAASNYRSAAKAADEDLIRHQLDQGRAEFGISEFSNLRVHEKLMPIHVE